MSTDCKIEYTTVYFLGTF